MGLRKLLAQLGRQSDEIVPAVGRQVDELAEEAVPAIRKTTIPTEVGPEVIGTGTSRAGREATEEIPDAIFTEITPTTGMDDMSFLSRMDPRLAKLIGGGAAVGAGAMMLGGGDDEVPPQLPMVPQGQSPSQPEKILPDNYMDLAQEEALNQSIVSSIPKGIPSPSSQRMDEPSRSPAEEQMNYLQMMKEAQVKKGESDIGALFAQAGADIAAGFGAGSGLREKPDYSTAEWLQKRGEKGVSDVKGLMETDVSEKKMKQLQKEMMDEEKLRDPNSDASKMTRDILSKYGLNVRTAKEAKDAGINVQNILLQELAAKNAKEVASLAKEQKVKTQEKALDEKQRKFAQSLRGELTSGVLGKQYSTFSTGQRMSSALQKFAENPTGYSDYATLMGGLKVLQGDESVVREAEVRLGMSATSLFESLQNQLQRAASGRSLQPSQRKAMIDTIQTLTDLSKQQYMQAAAPILEQGAMEGIPEEILLSGSLSGAKQEAKAPETTASALTTVTIRRKSDGLTKVMDAAKAQKMDPAKYEIVK